MSLPPTSLRAEPLEPTALLVDKLDGETASDVAMDISGIACMEPPGSARYRCLVVNDNNTFAQFVSVDGNRVGAGKTVPLIGGQPDPATLGTQPTAHCSNTVKEFGEFDGEGVAYAAPHFYVVGSHGCSRKKNKFRVSSFMLARFRVDKDGQQVGRDGRSPRAGTDPLELVERTYRLSEALQKAPKVAAFFGMDLENPKPTANGLNIEGLAVIGDRLFVGLRAPSLGGTAYILGTSVAELFAPGHAPAISKVETIELPLGEGRGVRDLATLPDGRLLVLTGPAQNQPDVGYGILIAEARPGGTTTELQALKVPTGGKAEAVTILEVGKDSLRVLVLFDGLANGAPHEYRVPLKK